MERGLQGGVKAAGPVNIYDRGILIDRVYSEQKSLAHFVPFPLILFSFNDG